jgi:oligoendopeptidase F
MRWTWPQIEPYYADLTARPLAGDTVDRWMADWTHIASLVDEASTRYYVATTANTADEEAECGYRRFLDEIAPKAAEAEQRLKRMLLGSGLEPAGFAVPLRKLRVEAELYREANLPLLSENKKLEMDYEKLAGSRTVMWEGQELPLVQLQPVLLEPDRDRRERAWRASSARLLQDTDALGELWRQMVTLRGHLARNAGLDTYRSYRWREMFRFDYTPEDARRFHDAIERAVVPAAHRIYEQKRQQLGLVSLRPWDEDVDPSGRPPLRPYSDIDELESKTASIFHRVHPRFAEYFETMRVEGLLDLDSRKNKAPGGYSLAYNVVRRPVIFTNAVGTHDNVQTLLHEGGHAFHTFEMAHLPYLQQRLEQMVPVEFAEVASMGMELLGSPYLTARDGGFYTEAEAARARIENLRAIITFWPYMATIDALQHWVFEHEDEAADIERCDDYWVTLVDRFLPDIDWSGLEAEKRSRWHRQSHPFTVPFYYIEYGMAQLGAVQVWANMLRDPASAVAAYRNALALGGTVTLPELYAAAGATFVFDDATLAEAVTLIERTIAELKPLAQEA